MLVGAVLELVNDLVKTILAAVNSCLYHKARRAVGFPHNTTLMDFTGEARVARGKRNPYELREETGT